MFKKNKYPKIEKEWKTENDFNDWVKNNLDYLAEVLKLGNDLTVDKIGGEREKRNPDQKRLDIWAKYVDPEDNVEKFIAIECQRTKGDFDHLGRLIMYMATMPEQPNIGVWITGRIDDSHKKSIEWLNTVSSIDFWLLTPEIVEIDNILGVKFNILAEPKNNLQQLEQQERMTETRIKYTKFWDVFGKVEEKHSQIFYNVGRGIKGWARLLQKKDITFGISCSNDKLFVKIDTKNEKTYTHWQEKKIVEKLGKGWGYREGGHKTYTYFIEKEIASGWQEHPEKWEEYSTDLINETSRVIELLETL